MLIRNITSSRDLENKKRLQAEMLQAQIDNEKILDERVRDYKNPNKPPAVPPQYKSNSEVLADSLEQQKEAIENLRSLGLGFDVAAQTSIELKNLPDGIANLVKLNKNFPFIKTDILKRYNVKLLDPKVLIEYFKEYFDNIDNIIGISIPSTSSTNYFDKGVSTSLIATNDDYKRLNAALEIVFDRTNINRNQIDELKSANDRMASISPTDAELQSINTFDAITRNKLKKEMEKLMLRYPSGKSINEITDNLTNQIKEDGIDTFALANAKAGGINVKQQTPESVINNLSILRRLLKNIPVLMKPLSDFTEKLKGQEDELKQKESDFYEKYEKGESKGEELTEIKIPKEIVEQQEEAFKKIEEAKKDYIDMKLEELQLLGEDLIDKGEEFKEKTNLRNELLKKFNTKTETEKLKTELENLQNELIEIKSRMDEIKEITEKGVIKLKPKEEILDNIDKLNNTLEELTRSKNRDIQSLKKMENVKVKEKQKEVIDKKEKQIYEIKKKMDIFDKELVVQREIKKSEKAIKNTEEEINREARNRKKKEIIEYLDDRVAGLKYRNLRDRIEMSPTVRGEFANFNPYKDYIQNVPTIDYQPPRKDKSNVIYEFIRDENDNLVELENPILKDGSKLNVDDFPFDKYYFTEVGSKYTGYDAKNKTVKKINTSGAYYRYTEDKKDDLRQIIIQNEIPLLYQRIDDDENYDPREEKYRRRISDGFGLTNNIIKHFNKDNKDMEKLSKSLKKHLKVEEKVDAPKKKGGSANFSARRIKIGKGLSPMEKEPIHKEFGKYIINMRQLKSGYLNLKHPSGSQIPSIPTVEVSKNYREFVLDVLENSKVNQRHYDILTNPEKAHFTNITKKAKLFDVLDFKAEENEEEKKDLERLELLFGEYNAGNDNPKMIKECKALIKKYIANGRIEQSRGLNMLMELD